ncbi:hypothetical protein D187_000669 [Cystobacter fuscus DSM 2262]|uniref:Uncharacterized protein n=1 Tax=Cystobacter fuscus (strain ATCC 25194 / DSM 2262 / NBRC 100088 / M29) TaxID=1242864 RepID=S9QV76_CYSF2|nr:hypothetical protein D187_000669 [Cystobacter fuscus DSM 2262]
MPPFFQQGQVRAARVVAGAAPRGFSVADENDERQGLIHRRTSGGVLRGEEQAGRLGVLRSINGRPGLLGGGVIHDTTR